MTQENKELLLKEQSDAMMKAMNDVGYEWDGEKKELKKLYLAPDKNPNSKTIAEYLYKEKGYPISLNGDIPTYEEVVKHVQAYNDYKMRQKACDSLGVVDEEPNLKSILHDASEEPTYKHGILYQDKLGIVYFTTKSDAIALYGNWETFVEVTLMTRWAYVSDLFPKQIGNSKQEKGDEK